jgi:DNA-binding transcriptional MerR regulator
VGLLSPADYTESGYRLYQDEDLARLQHILALKFLGLPLEEVRACLDRGPRQLAGSLAQQRAMMQEKRARLDAVIRAIAETESLLEAGACDWEAVARVIEVIRMEANHEWVRKYFTDEQLRTMQQLGQESYSEEARQKLAARMAERGAWTEQDQEKATADWTRVYSEARRLAAEGADPAGPEAQAMARLKHELLSAFTQGDPEIAAGVGQFWQNFHALPADQKPFDSSPFDAGPEGNAFLERACAIYAADSAA